MTKISIEQFTDLDASLAFVLLICNEDKKKLIICFNLSYLNGHGFLLTQESVDLIKENKISYFGNNNSLIDTDGEFDLNTLLSKSNIEINDNTKLILEIWKLNKKKNDQELCGQYDLTSNDIFSIESIRIIHTGYTFQSGNFVFMVMVGYKLTNKYVYVSDFYTSDRVNLNLLQK